MLRQSKVPMGLISDTAARSGDGSSSSSSTSNLSANERKGQRKVARMNLLSTSSFGSTFGPKKSRKRPKVNSTSLAGLMTRAAAGQEAYDADQAKGKIDRDTLAAKMDDGTRDAVPNSVFAKGQSNRIYRELYKVLDCSDVVVQVLDARDPLGTRSRHVEEHLRKDARHKHLIFVLNKCDLVPVWVTRRWVDVLSREYPTLAFHASVNNPFGKGSLIR